MPLFHEKSDHLIKTIFGWNTFALFFDVYLQFSQIHIRLSFDDMIFGWIAVACFVVYILTFLSSVAFLIKYKKGWILLLMHGAPFLILFVGAYLLLLSQVGNWHG